MPKSIVAEFKVNYLQVMDEQGNVDSKLEPQIDNNKLIRIYTAMVLSRATDEKAIKLQRTGRMATVAPAIGQEASQVASVAAMEEEDMIFPGYRQMGAYVYRNFPTERIYLYFKGHEDGMLELKEHNIFAVNIPVGTPWIHGAGYAYAMKLKGEKKATLSYTGDGGTSEGEAYEALNFAGVFDCPAVFVVENNQYAISTSRKNQTKAKTLAQKGIAAGIEFIQVDGNDFLAVYKAVKDARKKAVEEGIPTLIETITYRMSMHTTADDPSKYRKKEEENEWRKKDPIERAKNYLISKGIWSEEKDAKLKEETSEKVNTAATKADELITIKSETIFKHMFKEMPDSLKEQLEYQKRFKE